MTDHDEPPRAPGPSRGVLALAFVAVVVAGGCGAVIGVGLVSVGCHGSCTGAQGAAALVGGAAAAAGVGIVVILVLRAMAEWNRQSARPSPDE